MYMYAEYIFTMARSVHTKLKQYPKHCNLVGPIKET